MEQRLKQDIHIGDAIRSLRTEHHLTQEQVVAKLQLYDINITRSISSQIESGSYNIRISVLAGLCQIFHVDYNEFFRNIKLSDMEGTKQK